MTNTHKVLAVALYALIFIAVYAAFWYLCA